MLGFYTFQSNGTVVPYYREEPIQMDEPSPGQYYEQASVTPLMLAGRSAALLGLAGSVSVDNFEKLARNVHPATGERITQRNRDNRRDGTDCTFNFPKPYSIQFELAPDPALYEAAQVAVQKSMEEMERHAQCRVRVGRQNTDRVTANMSWVTCLHHTSRPVGGIPDMHVHFHVFVLNHTYDAVEGKWKALQMGEIRKQAPYFEAYFHTELQNAWREAGYELTKRGDRFVPTHISSECVQRFSRRTAVIEEAAQRRGITDDPERKAELGARTREKKDTSRSLAELREEWRSRMTTEELRAIEEARATAMRVRAEREQKEPVEPTRQAQRPVEPECPSDQARRAIARALDHSLEWNSTVPEKRLLALAMKKADAPVSPQQLAAALKERDLIRQDVQGQTLLTTPEVLQEEKKMLAFAREGRGTCAPFVTDANPTGVGSLSQEQHEAYRAVLGSYDRVTLLRGGAGTGRTSLIQEIVQAIEKRGPNVFAFAPTGEHVREELKREGLANAETVAKLFSDAKLQEKLRGQVLWIDEAGRLGVRGMARIFDIARERDARVILSGDEKRHGPVDRGGAFGLLARDAGVKPVELKAIERQRGDYRAALAAVAEGRTDSAWKRLEKLGSIAELPQREAHRQLAKEYVATTRRGRSALAVAPGRREREQVTQAIRRELREAGRIKGKPRRVDQLQSLGWSEAEQRDAANYRRGQVIQFFRPTRGFHTGDRTRVLGRDALGNVWVKGKAGPQLLKTSHGDRFNVFEKKSLELARGDTIRITGSGKTAIGNHILRSGSTYRVAGFVPLNGDLILNNGWIVRRSFGHLTHGYCVSSHTAQDKQVDRIFLAQSKESFRSASREQFHATLGAARQGTRIFTDDAQGLKQLISVPKPAPTATALEEAQLAARFDRHLNDMRQSHDSRTEPTL